MSLYIGIDGGGTRTTAVVLDAEGGEVARVDGGAGLIQATDPTAGITALANLVEAALRAANSAPPATSICCALAGAGRRDERVQIAAALQKEAVALKIRVIDDAEAAFHDAFQNRPGILLIAGTGSIALARNDQAETARVGGWGSLLGDQGSGYALGLATLRAAALAYDQRGPETMLSQAILEEIGLTQTDALIHWTAGATKGEIAALAPIAINAATDGDQVATKLVESAVVDLAQHIVTLEGRLSPWREPPEIALAGGLIAPGGPLRNRVIAAIGPEYPVRGEMVDAAHGAAIIALEG